jgi:hypothetical protein
MLKPDEDLVAASGGDRTGGQALFTLRSVCLLWRQGNRKGHPWFTNQLTLQCAVDTRLWSREGTAQVREQKQAEVEKCLTNLHGRNDLTPGQVNFLKRQKSVLQGLQADYPRPSHSSYKGQDNLIAGVSLDINQQISIAVINVEIGRMEVWQGL